MAEAADKLACLLNISKAAVGLTIGAAGTSLPNLFASALVARQGFGNMAVSNAFGSNVFNIFIALGLPWLIRCIIPLASGDASPLSKEYPYPYHIPGQQGELVISIVILFVYLGLFLLALVCTRLRLTVVMG